MLITAGKKNPNAILHGIDLDPRCAKMCALNLIIRELTGSIWCGNGLTGEMYTRWNISRGWARRDDHPAPTVPRAPEEPQQLALL